ncbi:MAG: hypothetical protein EOO09_13215 [Chitinophagaceae bacterium]|nr:MAG: hypothetical protein EOO09_13215 [Chitinophagaceae bacterium]
MRTLLFLIIASMLLACNKQGPMGIEGPQGPDGEPGNGGSGGGSSSITTYTITKEIQWREIDGLDGYVVYRTGPDQSILLPDSVVDAVDNGLVLVYLRSVENDWYRVPFEAGDQRNNDKEYYNYFMRGNELFIEAKIDESLEEPSVGLMGLKVVIGPPTRTGTIEFSD